MTITTTQPPDNTSQAAGRPDAARGLALVRMTIGAMFVWVFFENLGKGGYSPAGYAGVINYYIKASHSPAAWKAVMGFMASHAAIVAPMQALTEISVGVLLIIGLLHGINLLALPVMGRLLTLNRRLDESTTVEDESR